MKSLRKIFSDRATAAQAARQEGKVFAQLVEEVMTSDLSQRTLPELNTLLETLDPKKNKAAKTYLNQMNWTFLHEERLQAAAKRVSAATLPLLEQQKEKALEQKELDLFQKKIDLIAQKLGGTEAVKAMLQAALGEKGAVKAEAKQAPAAEPQPKP